MRRSGSSPRGRGTRHVMQCDILSQRFIPAWAGNTPCWRLVPLRCRVHPRVGGEHPTSPSAAQPTAGSSPRGRGTPIGCALACSRLRFIPAWAGNTVASCACGNPQPVHPRVGGEHPPASAAGRPGGGSSPRGRGTLARLLYGAPATRFIPAWAENTPGAPPRASPPAVHPRVGGEHGNHGLATRPANGSSPRGRGTRTSQRRAGRAVGFIPAWAGNTKAGVHTPSLERFIPAWAGNTIAEQPVFAVATVHPRMGGEHHLRPGPPEIAGGSSPRGRGTLSSGGPDAPGRRFIPAWAGNTLRADTTMRPAAVHPRVGGEHFTRMLRAEGGTGSSPRGRGTLHGRATANSKARFIPAWAGNTRDRCAGGSARAVHPRVGGEHIHEQVRNLHHRGSSPRGRGTLPPRSSPICVVRFIPAWAGNTLPACCWTSGRTVHPRVGGEHLKRLAYLLANSGSSPRGRGTPYLYSSARFCRRFIPAWAGNTAHR